MKRVALVSILVMFSAGCSDAAGGGTMVVRKNYNGTVIARGYEKGDGIQTGNWTYWFEDGTLRGEGRFVDGVKHGGWQWFDAQGRKLSQGDYDDGEKSGKWIVWHGFDRGGGQYVNGNKSGAWTEWEVSYLGDTRMQGEYVHGSKNGIWTTWYGNGNKKSEESYSEGIPHGMIRRWHENGKISYIDLDVRDPNSIVEEWFPNGNKGLETELQSDGRLRKYVWSEDGLWDSKESGIYGHVNEKGRNRRFNQQLGKIEGVRFHRSFRRFPMEVYQD